jgi:hypothetical protein
VHDEIVPIECRVPSEILILEGWRVPTTVAFASIFAAGIANEDDAKIEVKKRKQNRWKRGGGGGLRRVGSHNAKYERT